MRQLIRILAPAATGWLTSKLTLPVGSIPSTGFAFT